MSSIEARVQAGEIQDPRPAIEQLRTFYNQIPLCIPPDRKLRLMPLDGVLTTTPPLADAFLKDQKVTRWKRKRLFNKKGEFILPPGEENLYDMNPAQCREYIRIVAEPLFEVIDKSLQGMKRYNKHSLKHAEYVADTALRLVQEKERPLLAADSPEYYVQTQTVQDEEVEAVIAGMIHDFGYLLGDDSHALLSPEIAKLIFPSLENGVRWHNTKRAVYFHDSDVFRPVMNARDALDKMTVEDRIHHLKKMVGVPGLAVMIADKMNIGRERAGKVAHRHIADHPKVNLWMENAGFTKNNGDFNFTLAYNPTFRPEDFQNNPGLQLAKRRHEQGFYREAMILPGFEETVALTWRIYTKRFMTMVEAVFALYDEVNTVTIAMEGPRGLKVIHPFHRDTLDEDFAVLYEKRPV